MPKALSKSHRQYVHVNNGPAQRLARKTAGVKVAPMPDYIEPMLATEGAPPRGAGWVHENQIRRLSIPVAHAEWASAVFHATRSRLERPCELAGASHHKAANESSLAQSW
jgi:hypothetical protein